MDAQIQKAVENITAKLNRKSSAGARNGVNRGYNIFNKIMTHYENLITHSESLTLTYIFNYAEKSLSESRNKHYKTSTFWLNECSNYRSNLSASVRIIADTVIYPAIAFNQYSQNDFIGSKKNILLSLDSFRLLYDDGMTLCSLAWTEQYLNLCRIYYKEDEIHKAFTATKNLLVYLSTNQYHITESTDPGFCFNSVHTTHWRNMVDFTNEVFLHRMMSYNKLMHQDFFKEIFIPYAEVLITKEPRLKNFALFYYCIDFFHKENYAEYLTSLSKAIEFEDHEKSPAILQYLSLEYLINISTDPSQMRKCLDDYYEKHLIFNKNRFINTQSQNSSPLRKNKLPYHPEQTNV